MDDCTVWTMLRNCRQSAQVIMDLEHRRLLKCAYERTFYEKDTMVSSIFGRETHRKELRVDIARKAGVDADRVIIDVPAVPSVPYHHSALMEPMEIPTYYRTQDGKVVPQRLSEISRIFDTLRGFMNILRVYTDEKNRDRVNRAASAILGEIPAAAKISF